MSINCFSCLNRADLIRIYDGRTSSDPSIGVLCNQGTELEVLSTGSELFIEFVANSDMPGQGFKAIFQFQPIEDNTIGKQCDNNIDYMLIGMSTVYTISRSLDKQITLN